MGFDGVLWLLKYEWRNVGPCQPSNHVPNDGIALLVSSSSCY